jgi:hypothetical protein
MKRYTDYLKEEQKKYEENLKGFGVSNGTQGAGWNNPTVDSRFILRYTEDLQSKQEQSSVQEHR